MGTEGSISVAFSNKSRNRSFIVPTTTLGRIRVEYVLSAHMLASPGSDTIIPSDHDKRFDAKEVKLNGNLLYMGNSSILPKMRGHQARNDPTNPWMVAPASLGFVVFPKAGVSACSSKAQTSIDQR